MSDRKTVKDAWEYYGGVWPAKHGRLIFHSGCDDNGFKCTSSDYFIPDTWQKVCTKEKFEAYGESSDEWNGEGLPPVGSVVSFNANHGLAESKAFGNWRDGDELEVLAHKYASYPVAVVWNKRDMSARSLVKEGLKPIKTIKPESDQFVEKVKESFEYIAGESRHALIERLARFIYESEVKGH